MPLGVYKLELGFHPHSSPPSPSRPSLSPHFHTRAAPPSPQQQRRMRRAACAAGGGRGGHGGWRGRRRALEKPCHGREEVVVERRRLRGRVHGVCTNATWRSSASHLAFSTSMALLLYGPPLLPLQQQQTHSGWTAQRCGGGRSSSDGLGGLVMGSAGSSFLFFI